MSVKEGNSARVEVQTPKRPIYLGKLGPSDDQLAIARFAPP